MAEFEGYDDALARQAREARAEKRRQWEEIQKRAPDLAEFLALLAERFGKVELKQVEFAENQPFYLTHK